MDDSEEAQGARWWQDRRARDSAPGKENWHTGTMAKTRVAMRAKMKVESMRLAGIMFMFAVLRISLGYALQSAMRFVL